jgi:hypothetical protein
MRLPRAWLTLAAALAVLSPATGDAQAPKLARVGVVHHGGALDPVVDGLKAGLNESGLNLRTARELGLAIPPAILIQAATVIR